MSNNTRTRTAAKTAAKAAPKATPKADAPEAKDWTYLLEKDPSTLHTAFAAFISEETGVDFDPKHVQMVLAMHHTFQKGERNKARPDYKALDATIVAKRSEHMTLAHVEAKAERAKVEAAAQAKRDAAKAKRDAAAAKRKAAKEAAAAK